MMERRHGKYGLKVMHSLFNGIYQDITVLITGHSGFKGSWLAFWLKNMGAKVIGYSLESTIKPNHLSLLNLDIISIIADIRDTEKLNATIKKYKPTIVFHLAAQSLVRLSYENPVETYETNVMGTLNVFEACRKHKVKAIVNITSDKAYENNEWLWGYRENDSMGGYDPYSSSKGCAELLTSSYRNSYFNNDVYKKTHNTLLASCRAGNVIGGGDWARDRLMVDVMLATSQNKKVMLRNPNSTRPWQHVLDPLSGYLCIGQKLLEENSLYADGWNFGPTNEGNISVLEVVKRAKKYWDKVDYEVQTESNQLHEAKLLKLDCSKAYTRLNWRSVWDSEEVFKRTITWYKKFYENKQPMTKEDLNAYINDANLQNLNWVRS